MMFIVEFSSNAWQGKLWAGEDGWNAITAAKVRAKRFSTRTEAHDAARTLASEDARALAQPSDVCWQVRKV